MPILVILLSLTRRYSPPIGGEIRKERRTILTKKFDFLRNRIAKIRTRELGNPDNYLEG